MPYHPAARPLQNIEGRVSTIVVQVDALPDGRIRVSSPHARGWASAARTPVELARAVREAFHEVAVSSVARANHLPYDLDQLTSQVEGDLLAGGQQRRVRSTRGSRRPAHPPEAWERMEDGRWRSPSGRAYRENTTAVQSVLRKRQALGLPT